MLEFSESEAATALFEAEIYKIIKEHIPSVDEIDADLLAAVMQHLQSLFSVTTIDALIKLSVHAEVLKAVIISFLESDAAVAAEPTPAHALDFALLNAARMKWRDPASQTCRAPVVSPCSIPSSPVDFFEHEEEVVDVFIEPPSKVEYAANVVQPRQEWISNRRRPLAQKRKPKEEEDEPFDFYTSATPPTFFSHKENVRPRSVSDGLSKTLTRQPSVDELDELTQRFAKIFII